MNVKGSFRFKATALTFPKEFSLHPCEFSHIFETAIFQDSSDGLIPADLHL